MQKILEGRWGEMRGDVKRRWGRLTDDDITKARGRADKLAGMVQERYGYTRQKAQDEVNEFMRSYGADIQESARAVGSKLQSTAKQYPWAMAIAGILVMALVVGLVIRPSFKGGGEHISLQ